MTPAAPLAIRTLMVPLDGTPFAERALPTAISLAPLLGAQLELVHTLGTESSRPADRGYGELDRETAAAYLNSVARTIAAVEVSTRIETNPPEPEAGDAFDHDAGIAVCMATHGHSGAAGVVLGNVAEEILRQMRAPLVFVGPDVIPAPLPTEGGHLVLCYDGSDHAESVVPLAADLAKLLALEIHVVMVLHRHGDYLGDHDATRPKERAHDLTERLSAQGLAAMLQLLDGLEPARAINSYAADLPAALIVTASHGSSGVIRSLVGSTALRIVRHAPCPVVLRRPG